MTLTKVGTNVEITTVARAHTKFTGLKTAIPATYARELGIEAGDKLSWELDIDGGIKLLKVKKFIRELKID